MKGTHIQCSGIDKTRPEFTCSDHGEDPSEEEEEEDEEEEEEEKEEEKKERVEEKKRKKATVSGMYCCVLILFGCWCPLSRQGRSIAGIYNNRLDIFRTQATGVA